jgi:hypothetical protein
VELAPRRQALRLAGWRGTSAGGLAGWRADPYGRAEDPATAGGRVAATRAGEEQGAGDGGVDSGRIGLDSGEEGG